MKDENLEKKLNQGEAEMSLPEPVSGKKKKKKNDVEDYDIFEEKPKEIRNEKEKKEAQMDDISAIHEFQECNKVSKKLNRTFKAWAILLLACFIFIGGSYLIFNYSDTSWWTVVNRNHEHTFGGQGIRTEGDCQHYGYTTYQCDYPFCNEEKTILDSHYGNHKYHEEEKIEVEIDGQRYWQYTCYICDKPNLVPITNTQGG